MKSSDGGYQKYLNPLIFFSLREELQKEVQKNFYSSWRFIKAEDFTQTWGLDEPSGKPNRTRVDNFNFYIVKILPNIVLTSIETFLAKAHIYISIVFYALNQQRLS